MLTLAYAFCKTEDVQAETGNDTLLTASSIEFGTEYSKKLTYEDDVDWYRFTVDKEIGCQLFVTSYVPNGGLSVELYSEDGECLDEGRGYYFDDSVGFKKNTEIYYLRKGTYYIKFSSNTTLIGVIEASAGAYDFTLKDYPNTISTVPEPNNNFLSAYSINLGTRYQGIIDYFDSYDILKLKITEKARYDIEYYMFIDGKLELLDPTDEEVSTFNTAYYEDNKVMTQTIWLNPGEYYFRITPSGRSLIAGGGHENGLYRLKVSKHVEQAKSNTSTNVNNSSNTIVSVSSSTKKCSIKKKKKKTITFRVVLLTI